MRRINQEKINTFSKRALSVSVVEIKLIYLRRNWRFHTAEMSTPFGDHVQNYHFDFEKLIVFKRSTWMPYFAENRSLPVQINNSLLLKNKARTIITIINLRCCRLSQICTFASFDSCNRKVTFNYKLMGTWKSFRLKLFFLGKCFCRSLWRSSLINLTKFQYFV